MKHYHVETGFAGCYPESNVAYKDKGDALKAFADIIADYVELGKRFICLWVNKAKGDMCFADADIHSTFYVHLYACEASDDVCKAV